VEVRPARLHDRDRESLPAVGEGEVRRRADVLGERPEHRPGHLPQDRLETARQGEDTESDVQPPRAVTTRQAVLLERGHEPVHHGPVDPDLGGELGDGQATRAAGEHLQHQEAAVQGL